MIEFGKETAPACLTDEPIDNKTEICVTIGWFDMNGEIPQEIIDRILWNQM